MAVLLDKLGVWWYVDLLEGIVVCWLVAVVWAKWQRESVVRHSGDLCLSVVGGVVP